MHLACFPVFTAKPTTSRYNTANFKMPRTFRIAVLECDTVIDTIKETRGLYGDIFRDLINRGVSSSEGFDASFEVSSWNVMQGKFPAAGEFDGLLLSGSSKCFSVGIKRELKLTHV
jgi:hypothetical protein